MCVCDKKKLNKQLQLQTGEMKCGEEGRWWRGLGVRGGERPWWEVRKAEHQSEFPGKKVSPFPSASGGSRHIHRQLPSSVAPTAPCVDSVRGGHIMSCFWFNSKLLLKSAPLTVAYLSLFFGGFYSVP